MLDEAETHQGTQKTQAEMCKSRCFFMFGGHIEQYIYVEMVVDLIYNHLTGVGEVVKILIQSLVC